MLNPKYSSNNSTRRRRRNCGTARPLPLANVILPSTRCSGDMWVMVPNILALISPAVHMCARPKSQIFAVNILLSLGENLSMTFLPEGASKGSRSTETKQS